MSNDSSQRIQTQMTDHSTSFGKIDAIAISSLMTSLFLHLQDIYNFLSIVAVSLAITLYATQLYRTIKKRDNV
jgi:hypothetical protein